MAGQLAVVNGIATTLIALIAGLTLNIERLGDRLGPIARTTAWTLAVPIAGLIAVGWVAWPWLPIAPEIGGLPRLAIAALVAVIVVSFSPTMTAAVIADAGGRNRLGDLVLAMVVLADLALLVLFATTMSSRAPPSARRRDERRRAPHPHRLGNRRSGGLRRAGGIDVRALPALHRTRSAARAHGPVRAVEPGGVHPAVRTAAGGRGGGLRHREPPCADTLRTAVATARRRCSSCSSSRSAPRCVSMPRRPSA
jgi:hypothetical protein